MFIESVPNRDSPPAVLLRESYRDENGRPQKRTLANLSKLPDHVVAALKAILKGGTLIGTGPNHLQVERSLPHGHVAAALGMIRKIALDRLILSTGRAKVRHDAVRPPNVTCHATRRGGSGLQRAAAVRGVPSLF
jgi:hypothetical protein